VAWADAVLPDGLPLAVLLVSAMCASCAIPVNILIFSAVHAHLSCLLVFYPQKFKPVRCSRQELLVVSAAANV